MLASTDAVLETQTSLMQIAQDILADVKEAGSDMELLHYAAGRAKRRLNTVLGEVNPDLEALRAVADRADFGGLHEVSGLLDEERLVAMA